MNHCATFTRIKTDYERAIVREEESAERRSGTSQGKVVAVNAAVIRKRMATVLNNHLRRCRVCG